MLLATTINW